LPTGALASRHLPSQFPRAVWTRMHGRIVHLLRSEGKGISSTTLRAVNNTDVKFISMLWLGRWNYEFESHSGHGCLVCVCVVLCLDSCLATGWSLVRGVLPSVKNYY
jgi:hypothetical protein